MDGEDAEIIVSDDEVVLDCGESDEQISMSLPEEFNHIEGTLAGDGTIVYAEDDADAALAVQAVQEQQDGFCLDGFRSLVTIENAQAPHEYSFQFGLPEGATLVQDGDYINIINENSMVTDENGDNPEPEVIGVIEPVWAKDSNGESVNTYCNIEGNVLTQVVEFDENSAFPIIADPTITKVKPHRVWSIKSSEMQDITTNGSSWQLYDKQPVKKGTYYTLEYSGSYKGSISGELKVTASQLEAKLGFSYSQSKSFSKAITERATKKSYAYGYYRKQYRKYKVVQIGKLVPGHAKPIYKTVYVYKPAMPQLKIEFK